MFWQYSLSYARCDCVHLDIGELNGTVLLISPEVNLIPFDHTLIGKINTVRDFYNVLNTLWLIRMPKRRTYAHVKTTIAMRN